MARSVKDRHPTITAAILALVGFGLLVDRARQPSASRTKRSFGLPPASGPARLGHARIGGASSRPILAAASVVIALLFAALGLGWLRHPLQLRTDPPVAADLAHYRLMQNGIGGTPPESYFARGQPYEATSWDLAQGKRLYAWFGCHACHGDGKGGAGPSFLDGWWLYGPEMVSIVASIREGRPHGMPPFRDRMTDEQIWQLAGYVQAIGAYKAKMSSPGRDDARMSRPAENRAPAAAMFEQGPMPLHPDQGPTP